jgi:hypothetical protein
MRTYPPGGALRSLRDRAVLFFPCDDSRSRFVFGLRFVSVVVSQRRFGAA